MLADTYAPTTLNGIVGNYEAIKRLKEFGEKALKNEKQTPLLLYGPAGTGKTSAARALAYMFGFDIFELNASDYRDGETLKRLLMPASSAFGLFSKKQLILLDEIDELSKKFDAGSEKVILEFIKASKHPVIFTANDYWDQKISFLREHVEKVEFKRVAAEEITGLLKKIAKNEGKEIEEDLIENIARRSNGDVRSAINDLDIMIGADPDLIEYIGIRDRKRQIFEVLDKIFMSRSLDASRNAVMFSDTDTDMLAKWIDENIPNRYTSAREVADAYSFLSKGSFFLEKASRTSYYGYLRYASVLMSGVAVANIGYVSMVKHYAFPQSIRFLSRTKLERNVMNAIATKLVYLLHANKVEVLNMYVPLFQIMIAKGAKEEGSESVAAFFEKVYQLSKEEVGAIAETPAIY
ncbi:MAG: replication factor C large subunit [Candidatus Micrarchaeia archaeon]